MVATLLAASVPTLVILAAFWKLSAQLSAQDTTLKSLSERVTRIEQIVDKGSTWNRRGRRL